MFTWAASPTRRGRDGARRRAARDEGLAIVAGNEFGVDGGFDQELRLSYSTLTPAELAESMGLLTRRLRQPWLTLLPWPGARRRP